MQVTTKEIKNIKVLHPELMNSNFANLIRNYLTELELLKNEMWQLRKRLFSLEEKEKEVNQLLSKFKNLYEIEYETKEVEDKTEQIFFTVNESNGTVHSYGN